MEYIRKIVLLMSFLLPIVRTCKLTTEIENDALDVSSEQQSRLDTVDAECEKFREFLKYQKWEDSVPHMIVDDERKLMFCAIPKVASSNWKRVFIDALNVTSGGASTIADVHQKYLLPDIRDYTREEQEYRLKNYFKFMFVRDPLERLLSAYRNKLENREIEWVPTKKPVRDTHGRYSTQKEVIMRVKKSDGESEKSGNSVTFSQFVHTLTDPGYVMKHINVHWKQYNKLCHPCFVKYDYVGKMETLSQDLEYIKRKTGLDHKTWFQDIGRSTTPDVSKAYYKTLSPRKVESVLDMYKTDLAMFQYNTH